MKNRFTIRSIERVFKHKFSVATRIQLLWKGRDSFRIIFDAVDRAENLICLQFYIFKNGILDVPFALQMTEVFEEDLKNSTRIDEVAWRQRPFPEKVKEHFFALFRKRL